ncbi:MAG TPA: glycosyl hydrolase 53 family protein [Verrucomicrobiae bacterium]|nr:glycosyl hydrolase 53 family protein [Verrucomicrobiae bacterium]
MKTVVGFSSWRRPLISGIFLTTQLALAATGRGTEYAIGADLSFLTQAEARGTVFKDGGLPEPALEIFRSHGYNWVRLRLFHTPTRLPNNLDYTISAAKRAKELGFRFLLDFHYSDTWADPEKQFIPTAWQGKSHPELVQAVFDYTRDTIFAFRNAGVLPDMVQIGNEITGGMLWPDGKLPQNWDNFADLIKAGIRGVDAGRGDGPRPRIMIHIDRGADRGATKWFFDKLNTYNIAFDVIGLSYYPWWHGSLDALRDNLTATAADYHKDIIVVETAYPWRPSQYQYKGVKAPFPETPQGQREFLEELNRIVMNLPDHRGKGIFWWEPAVAPKHNIRGMFDDDGNALPVLSVFDCATNAEHIIDLTHPVLSLSSGHFKMGGKNPQGIEISATSRYLTMNGKPWFPVMGEFHYSRYPHESWEEELLKMKAGGITVVSTYIFWIHHEEIEGRFDWSGDRNLRRFVQLCAKHGLYCYLRLGPWAHGEARNGGFPDWLLRKCGKDVRKDAEPYLTYVRRFYAEIGKQVRGLLWKDGGPVIGVQLENEYHGDPSHILTLKKIAREAGFDVPLYSITGWDWARVPEGDEVLPMFGGYVDGFWAAGVSNWARDGRKQYFFGLRRDDSTVGNDLLKKPGSPDSSILERYPYATCEIGAGMEVSYRRRPVIDADDIAAAALVKIGSGSNVQGYYMYHGGSNPPGKLSTLNETRTTGYPNDMPVIDYDFQAPLGEFGQRRPTYDALRVQHMFLKDFGRDLASLPCVLPEKRPKSLDDLTTLRWSARSDGKRGFLFINNYQHIERLPDHDHVQFELRLKDETLLVPDRAIRIPKDVYMIWPFNMDLGGVQLKYATAQPLCRVGDCFVFAATPGVDPEFVMDRTCVRGLHPGTDCIFTLGNTKILLLTPEQARHCWKANIWGTDRVFLSKAGLVFDGDKLRVQSRNPGDLSFAVYPAPPLRMKGVADGVFTRFSGSVTERKIAVKWKELRSAAAVSPVKVDAKGVAFAPNDAEFTNAAVWQVRVAKDALKSAHEVFLRIHYVGDIGRARLGDRLVSDDFYFGRVWEIGLKRFSSQLGRDGLTLQILPLRRDAPIYMPADRWPSFGGADQAVGVQEISAQPEYELVVSSR